MSEIKNAVITDTFLGREDHGIFTFVLYVDIAGGSSCGIGSYGLDYTKNGKRIFSAKSAEVISRILEVVGVRHWESLKGKHIRVIDEGWGEPIRTIGNLMDDKWLNFKEFFADIEV